MLRVLEKASPTTIVVAILVPLVIIILYLLRGGLLPPPHLPPEIKHLDVPTPGKKMTTLISVSQYFIEPETRKRFRSVPEVEAYLARQKYKTGYKTLAFTKDGKAPRSRAPRRKKICSVNKLKAAFFDLTNPPNKINWVFSGDGKDNWSPLEEECVLPDYVKEQWAETFLMGMNGWKHRIPQVTMGESNQASNA